VRTSKDNVVVNSRKKAGFYLEILQHMRTNCPITDRRTYDMINEKRKIVHTKVAQFFSVYDDITLMASSGVGDGDYTQRALTEYQAE
ncbi:hypothetical protein Tco_0550345, partial [Tanacetum coccineum]